MDLNHYLQLIKSNKLTQIIFTKKKEKRTEKNKKTIILTSFFQVI